MWTILSTLTFLHTGQLLDVREFHTFESKEQCMGQLLSYAEKDQSRGFEIQFKDDIIVTLTSDYMTVSTCIQQEKSS